LRFTLIAAIGLLERIVLGEAVADRSSTRSQEPRQPVVRPRLLRAPRASVTIAADPISDHDQHAHHNSLARIFPKLVQIDTTKQILALLVSNQRCPGGRAGYIDAECMTVRRLVSPVAIN
jgi:hypothetical protein